MGARAFVFCRCAVAYCLDLRCLANPGSFVVVAFKPQPSLLEEIVLVPLVTLAFDLPPLLARLEEEPLIPVPYADVLLLPLVDPVAGQRILN